MMNLVEYKKIVSKISIPADHKIKQKTYLQSGALPVIDQGQELVGGYTDDCQKQIVCDLPVIVFGDHTKNVKYINFPFCAGADGIKILKAKDDIFPKYLYYGTKFLTFCIEDKGYAIHYQHIEKQELSVPPLPEQERIVAKIEELFSQLDAAVAELKSVKEKLAIYRQAVLKEAFDKLSTIKIRDICIHVTDGDHMPPPKAQSGIPFIMISNIHDNRINWTNTCFVNEQYFKAISEKRIPQRGDVLYTVTGSFGIPVKIDFDIKFCFQRHIALLRPDQNLVMQDFLYYALQSPAVFLQASKRATGTAQKTVGLTVLRDLDIPFINDKIQQQSIVLDVESKLSIYCNIEQAVDTALQQAAALRQSILKQAFEGNL